MVGNCAHCHNPRGFPSIRQPALEGRPRLPARPGPERGNLPVPARDDEPDPQARAQSGRPDPVHHAVALRHARATTRLAKFFCPDQPSGACARTNDGAAVGPRPLAQPHLPQRRHAVRLLRRLRALPAHAAQHLGLRLPRRAAHGRLDGQHSGADEGPDEVPERPSGRRRRVTRRTPTRPAALPGGPSGRQRLRRPRSARRPCGSQQYHTIGYRYGSARAPTRPTSSIRSSSPRPISNQPVHVRRRAGFYSPTNPNLLIMPPI